MDKEETSVMVNFGIMMDPHFDETQYCDKEIMPLLEELRKKCMARNIPALIAIAPSSQLAGCHITMLGCYPGARMPGPLKAAHTLISMYETFPLPLRLLFEKAWKDKMQAEIGGKD